MRRAGRTVLALLVGGLAVVAATGAGTAAAPGANRPPPDPEVAPCTSDSGVTVGWLIDADITLVRAVEVGGLPQDCRRQFIRIRLRDLQGNLLAEADQRKLGSQPTAVIELDEPVAASAVTQVEVVIGGTGSSG